MIEAPSRPAEVCSARPRAERWGRALAALALATLGCRFGYEDLDPGAIEATGGTSSIAPTGGTSSIAPTGGTSSTTSSGGSPSLGGSSARATASTNVGGSSLPAPTGGTSSTTSSGGSPSLGGSSARATASTNAGGSSLPAPTGGTSSIAPTGGTSSIAPTGGTSSIAPTGGTSSTTSSGGSPSLGGSSARATGTGGTAADSGTPLPYCQALPHLPAVPALDGVVDSNLLLENVVPQGWSNRTTPLPAGVSLDYAAAWHETGFYFFFRVTDPDLNPAATTDPVWYGDAIEIYVDHDAVFAPPNSFDAVGTRQFIVGAPTKATSNSTRADIFVADGVERPWPATQWKGMGTTSGYIVEVFVVAADLSLSNLQLTLGQQVGFDLGHDVSYSTGRTGMFGNRLGQYFLQVRQPFTGQGNDYPFIDTSVFCTPILVGE